MVDISLLAAPVAIKKKKRLRVREKLLRLGTNRIDHVDGIGGGPPLPYPSRNCGTRQVSLGPAAITVSGPPLSIPRPTPIPFIGDGFMESRQLVNCY